MARPKTFRYATVLAESTGTSRSNIVAQIIDITPEVIRDYFEEITPPPEEGSEQLDSMPKPSSTAPANSNVQSPIPPVEPIDQGPSPHLSQEPIASPVIDTALFATDDFTFLSPNLSDSVLEDGIFLPGSHFQELHTQLRSRIFDTARSAFPSRFGTPEIFPEPASELPLEDDEESRRLAHLSPEQEYRLWDNYINEVASWVDKFDSGTTDSILGTPLPILLTSPDRTTLGARPPLTRQVTPAPQIRHPRPIRATDRAQGEKTRLLLQSSPLPARHPPPLPALTPPHHRDPGLVYGALRARDAQLFPESLATASGRLCGLDPGVEYFRDLRRARAGAVLGVRAHGYLRRFDLVGDDAHPYA